MNIKPLSLEDWTNEFNIEKEYERFHDEYGASACMMCDYKKYHYDLYIREFQKELDYQKRKAEDEAELLNELKIKYPDLY